MEIKYKIVIPEPCHEDWNQMTPDETGRFCNSCVKSVVDFTKMKAPEIQQYFVQNQGQKICGRFNNGQLDSVIIQIPQEVLFSQVHFHKMFMLALLISMGTSLFSCQNTNGDRQKIDKIEVVETKVSRTMGAPIYQKATDENYGDTLSIPAKTKKTVPTKTGEVAIVTSGIVSVEPHPGPSVVADENTVYHLSTVEVQPTFPGGLTKFYEYVNSNLKLSEEDGKITQRLIVSFIVDSDGSLTEVKMLRKINETLDNEVVRVVKESPKWIPGKLKGENVKVSYSLPLKITAQ